MRKGSSLGLVPLGVCCAELGSLEVMVKYLREEEGLSLSRIALLLGRDQRCVGVSYRAAVRKVGGRLRLRAGVAYEFPVLLLCDRRLSVLEHVVWYLVGLGLGLSEVGVVLGRDPRTVWTVYHRGLVKQARTKRFKKDTHI